MLFPLLLLLLLALFLLLYTLTNTHTYRHALLLVKAGCQEGAIRKLDPQEQQRGQWCCCRRRRLRKLYGFERMEKRMRGDVCDAVRQEKRCTKTQRMRFISEMPFPSLLILLSTTPTFPPFLLAPLLCFPRRDRNCKSSSTRAFRAWYACRSSCPSTAGVTCSSIIAAATLVLVLVSPPSARCSSCLACLISTEKEEDDDGVNEMCRLSGRRTPKASTSVSLSRSAWAVASSLASARSSCSFNRRPRS